MNDRYKLVDRVAVLCPDLAEWAAAYQDCDATVARTEIGFLRVSTIFLTLDIQDGDGPPHLFETMIFGAKGRKCLWHCATWVEAEGMHRDAEKVAQAWIDEALKLGWSDD